MPNPEDLFEIEGEDEEEELIPTDEQEGIVSKETVAPLTKEEAMDAIEALGCVDVMLTAFYERPAMSGIWGIAAIKDGIPYVINNQKTLNKAIEELQKEISK